jgi:hypothetical protein
VYHHHGINQGNDDKRTRGVIRTMENNKIRPDEDIGKLSGSPLQPKNLDIVSFVPVQFKGPKSVDNDKTLVEKTVRRASSANHIVDVVLLSDSEHIVDEARKWGAKVPFIRPQEFSNRDVKVAEVFRYALKKLEEQNWFPDLVVTMEVTHPFRPSGLLDGLIEEIITGGHDTVVATSPECRPCWTDAGGTLNRVGDDADFRFDRSPIQVGLLGLGCVTYPKYIRDGIRTGGDIGIYEVKSPLASTEIRERDSLKYWHRLRDLNDIS